MGIAGGGWLFLYFSISLFPRFLYFCYYLKYSWTESLLPGSAAKPPASRFSHPPCKPAMLPHSLSRLAVPSVTALISVLAYPSQYFLLAAHFSRNQHIFFNVLVACIWTTYFRTVFTDPGSPPPAWTPSGSGGLDAEEGRGRGEQRRLVASTTRWCKRCERFKPARTHHCRTCKRSPPALPLPLPSCLADALPGAF